MGDTGAKMTSRHTHQTVVDRLRTRLEHYKKHHNNVQSKYESSLPAMEEMDRKQALVLQQRVLLDRERKLLKGKQQDGEMKVDQPPNGVDIKSTNAILQQHLKRKSLTNPHSLLCGNEKENGTGECRTKRQREDIAFPLHSREQQMNSSSSQHENISNNIPGQQDDHTINFPGGNTASNCGNPGPHVGSTIRSPGLGGFSTDGPSLQPSDFKQENQATMSCEDASSAGQSSTTSNEAGQPGQATAKFVGTYLAQELNDFERVFQGYKKAEESKTKWISDVLGRGNITSQGQETSGKQRANLVTQHEVEQNQRMQSLSLQAQLTNRQVGPPRLQEFAHETSIPLTPSRKQGRSFIVSDGHGQTHSQYSSEHAQLLEDGQDIPQRASFQPNLFSAFGNASQLPSENLHVQGYPVRNQGVTHNHNDPLRYQRTSQTRNSQQSVYSFPQQNLSSKLSHPPLEGQLRPPFPQHFQNAQVVPSSLGRASAPPVGQIRLSGVMYASTQLQRQSLYQRQQSVPAIPRQPFIGMEPLQQEMQPFQTSDQQLLPNTQPASYHYQRRNSFPLYQRNNMQALRGFAQSSQPPVHSQQMRSLTSALQNSGSKFGPSIPASSGPTRMQVNPYQSARVNTELPQSHVNVVSSGFYKGQRQDNVTSLPQPTHAGRKVSNGGVYPYSMNPSMPVRSAGDAGCVSFSGSLVKAPLFTSLLEQSTANQGNLETTYTGSIPNLELLGEILGP